MTPRSRLIAGTLFGLAVVTGSRADPAAVVSPAETCATVPACIARLRALAAVDANGHQLVDPEEALVDRLAPMPGADAAVVPLLADPDERVAGLAGAVLRDVPAIDARFLSQVRAGMDRGLGWLAPALARIPGEAAAQAAVHYYLAASSSPHNQEAYAVRLLGARAVPPLLAAARCPDGCTPELAYLIGTVLGELDQHGIAAAPAFVALAADPQTPPAVAANALASVAELGRRARTLGPALLALRASRPVLEKAVDDTLFALRVPEAAPGVARRLRAEPSPGLLEELAAFGSGGRAAGPVVLGLLAIDVRGPAPPLLDDDPTDLRVAAARTLGAIGHDEAVPALREALHDPVDVRLAWAAAIALGQLRAIEAAPELEAVARTHWHPSVRNAAARAVASLSAPAPEPPVDGGYDDEAFTFRAFSEIDETVENCGAPLVQPVAATAGELDGSNEAHQERLEALAFDAVVLSYGPDDEAAQRAAATAKGEDSPIIEVHPGNMVEHRQPVREVPAVALRVDGGWLAGSNRGEWGGELVFLADGAAPVRVYDGNVEDIYLLGDRLVALVGIAHLAYNEGRVLELARTAEGRWHATTWRVLPGAPRRSWRVDGGELLIDTAGGGTLLLAADGTFRMAPCAGGG